jgi:hypothetical protein
MERMQILFRGKIMSDSIGLNRPKFLKGAGMTALAGADGAMTGFAYPEMLVEVVALRRAGEVDRVEDLFDAYLLLVRHEQQPRFGLALRKGILFHRGAMASPRVRAPGPVLNQTDKDELTRILGRVEKKSRSYRDELRNNRKTRISTGVESRAWAWHSH